LSFPWQALTTIGKPSELSSSLQASSELTITLPKDGEAVPERPEVEGIAHPGAEVWVIVHPTLVSDYWIQPRLTVRADGKWRVNVYIGRPGNLDVGKHFEIMAVANPKRALKEGDILHYWPEAAAKSKLIEVVRK
jgi:hypothetical protein